MLYNDQSLTQILALSSVNSGLCVNQTMLRRHTGLIGDSTRSITIPVCPFYLPQHAWYLPLPHPLRWLLSSQIVVLSNCSCRETAHASLDRDRLDGLNCGSISIDLKCEPTGHQNVEEDLGSRIWKYADNLCNVYDHNWCNDPAC